MRAKHGTVKLQQVTRMVATIVPGLALSVGLAVLAVWASGAWGKSKLGDVMPVSSVMLSVILGLATRNLLRIPSYFQPGVSFAVKRVLRLGIVFLGIRLSIVDVLNLGALAIPTAVICTAVALFSTIFLARRMSIPSRLGTLIAVGTSICGVSAILATAPAINAEDEEVAYAIAVITVFGLTASVAYPYLAEFLFLGDPVKVGLFLGTSIHDTSQVAGAAMMYAQMHAAPSALDAAVVIKLIRNVLMTGVIPLAAVMHSRNMGGSAPGWRPALRKVLPLFVLGFLGVAAVRGLGDATADKCGRALGFLDRAQWERVVAGIGQWSGYLLVVALAALGLSAGTRKVRALGAKPLLVGLCAAVLAGAVSYVVVTTIS